MRRRLDAAHTASPFHPPSTAADYARLDLSTLAPDARYVGVIGEDQSGYLLTADGAAPTRIENLTGGQPHIRQYAQCIVFKALLDVLPAKTGATIDSCTQEGRDVAIWRVKFHLDRGGTVMDVRKQAARVESAVGATHVYWDWQKADMASLWLCRDPHLGVEDLPHWRRRQMQKLLIELALSDAWGDAGVTDSAGRTPKVVKLGALPHNHDVLLARFDIPAGLDVDKPQHNIGKFMTAAGYGYGRILPAARNMARHDTTWCSPSAALPHHGRSGLGFRPRGGTTHVPARSGRYG